MGIVAEWRSFDSRQKSAFIASFLGWTLDAFDFFLMVFVLRAVATEFGTSVKAVVGRDHADARDAAARRARVRRCSRTGMGAGRC